MRLHTHALLSALGYTNGLWSPLRGFARSTDRYYALLAATLVLYAVYRRVTKSELSLG